MVVLGSIATWKHLFLLVLKNENCIPAGSALIEQILVEQNLALDVLWFLTALQGKRSGCTRKQRQSHSRNVKQSLAAATSSSQPSFGAETPRHCLLQGPRSHRQLKVQTRVTGAAAAPGPSLPWRKLQLQGGQQPREWLFWSPVLRASDLRRGGSCTPSPAMGQQHPVSCQ